MGKRLRFLEVSQVLVIHEDHDGVSGASEILMPFGESVYDCEEFTIIDVVVAFSGGEYFGDVGARVEIAVRVLLHEDPSRGGE